MVVTKIKSLKDNKSHGADEIPPRPIMKTVEHVSVLLARVIKLSLKRDWFPFNGKKQTSCHYLERFREISWIITEQFA